MLSVRLFNGPFLIKTSLVVLTSKFEIDFDTISTFFNRFYCYFSLSKNIGFLSSSFYDLDVDDSD